MRQFIINQFIMNYTCSLCSRHVKTKFRAREDFPCVSRKSGERYPNFKSMAKAENVCLPSMRSAMEGLRINVHKNVCEVLRVQIYSTFLICEACLLDSNLTNDKVKIILSQLPHPSCIPKLYYKEANKNLAMCPDCGNSVSKRATHCLKCGCPASEFNNDTETNFKDYSRPKIDNERYVGAFVEKNLCKATVYYFDNINPLSDMVDGFSIVRLCQHGIRIEPPEGSLQTIIYIHCSQIVDIVITRSGEESRNVIESRSVLGRALLGHVLFGTTGAIVGGISGVPNKNIKLQVYCHITYFDPYDLRGPHTITLCCDTSVTQVAAIENIAKNALNCTAAAPLNDSMVYVKSKEEADSILRSIKVYSNQYRVFIETKQYRKALNALLKIIKLKDDAHDAYLKAAFLCKHLNDNNRYMIFLKKAASLGSKKAADILSTMKQDKNDEFKFS